MATTEIRPGWNTFEIKARSLKVRRIVGVVVRVREPMRSDLCESITSDTLGNDGWMALEKIAGVLPLSLKSRRVVAEILRHT